MRGVNNSPAPYINAVCWIVSLVLQKLMCILQVERVDLGSATHAVVTYSVKLPLTTLEYSWGVWV